MLNPLRREDLKQFEPLFSMAENVLGFLPNSMLTMGRDSELIYAFSMLSSSVLREKPKASLWRMLGLALKHLISVAKRQRCNRKGIDSELKWLIAYLSSSVANCRYCQAHTAHSAYRANVSLEKINQAMDFETSSLFSDKERAALRLVSLLQVTEPKTSREEIYREILKHFNDDEILQLVAIISLFGFLNRWNELLATPLEEAPKQFLTNLSPQTMP